MSDSHYIKQDGVPVIKVVDTTLGNGDVDTKAWNIVGHDPILGTDATNGYCSHIVTHPNGDVDIKK